MKKKRFDTFNDGMLSVCSNRSKKTDFSATENAKTKDDLKEVVKLAYEEKTKRDRDLEFADSRGCTLSLKVKTRLYPNINAKHKVLIGNRLYSIISVDEDKANSLMYFYLEEERCIK